MGGNVFKGKNRRYQADEYHEIVPEVIDYLCSRLGCNKNWLMEIPAYTSKQSFGDLDLVVCSEEVKADNWKQLVEADGFPVVSNSGVHSILFKDLQVDLIFAKRQEFWSTICYFQYNDMSNILGRIMHKMGLKYGHTGLSIVVRDDLSNHILKEIMLETDGTKCRDIVSEILGIDRNFEPVDLTDIFEYAASSKYFDPEIFSLENRNATSRIRDKKRQVYRDFLQWIEDTQPETKHSFPSKSELGGYVIKEPYYTDIILKYWPWVDAEVKALKAQDNLNKEFAKIINGKLIGELTGYTDKELGEFMKFISPVTKSAGFKQFVVGLGQPEWFISDFIRTIQQTYATETLLSHRAEPLLKTVDSKE